MPEPHFVVRAVDFASATDVKHYLDLLDAYARDPMGGGESHFPQRCVVASRPISCGAPGQCSLFMEKPL